MKLYLVEGNGEKRHVIAPTPIVAINSFVAWANSETGPTGTTTTEDVDSVVLIDESDPLR